jgi:heme exporter protein B
VGAFAGQLRREWQLVVRTLDEVLNPLLFLFLAIMLFALAAGGSPDRLAEEAGAIIWVLVLLSSLLGLEVLFRRDYEDGSLEQLMLQADPVFLPLLAKVLVHWLFSGGLLTLLAPLMALVLYLPGAALPSLILSLLVGSPALSLIGAVGAALTVGLGRGGVLLALLVLPLYVPVLIFGAGAVSQSMAGVEATAQIFWLGVITMMALTLAPFAVQAALKVSLEQ